LSIIYLNTGEKSRAYQGNSYLLMQSKMLKFHSGKMLSIFFSASELDNVFLIFAGKKNTSVFLTNGSI